MILYFNICYHLKNYNLLINTYLIYLILLNRFLYHRNLIRTTIDCNVIKYITLVFECLRIDVLGFFKIGGGVRWGSGTFWEGKYECFWCKVRTCHR